MASFFEQVGQYFGQRDEERKKKMAERKAIQEGRVRNIKEYGRQLASGYRSTSPDGDRTRRSQGGAGAASLTSDPTAVQSGVGRPDQYKPQVETGALADLPKPEAGLIGSGTPDSPFVGTGTAPRGFGEATPEDITIRNENTAGGRYLAGSNAADANAAVAAYDLYRADQMRQVAQNDRGLENLLAANDRDKQLEQMKKEGVRMRHARARGDITGRRYGEFVNEQQATREKIAETGYTPQRIAALEGANLAEMAKAQAGAVRAGAEEAKARASIYKTDQETGIEIAKLKQEEGQFEQSRYLSPVEATKVKANLISSSDVPDALLKDDDFMERVNQLVSQGQDPVEAALSLLPSRPLGG